MSLLARPVTIGADFYCNGGLKKESGFICNNQLIKSIVFVFPLHFNALYVGGGFHHCSRSRGGGFCAYADITLAVQVK